MWQFVMQQEKTNTDKNRAEIKEKTEKSWKKLIKSKQILCRMVLKIDPLIRNKRRRYKFPIFGSRGVTPLWIL